MVTATRLRLPSRGYARAFRGVLGLLGATVASFAYGGSWKIAPQMSVTETYSDNMSLAANSMQSGWISNLAPGIRIDGLGARFNAFLDYRREYLRYQGNSQWNGEQNQLTSYAALEAVENWLFVDASANITQRNLSVFDPVSVDGGNATSNQVETKTAQVSPYVRGTVANLADYLFRVSSTDSSSDDPNLADTRVDQVVASLKNHSSAATIGWFGNASTTEVRNDVIGERDDARFRLGVLVPVGAHVHLSVFGGRERTNYASLERETTSTPGVGFEWSPSKMTQVAGLREKRFFGYGHNLLLAHRTALTAWRYTNTKDVAVLPTLLAGYNPGSIHEMMSDMLTASIPDPVERDRAVRARMDMLVGSGARPAVGGGVQTSRFYIDSAQEASVALIGIRNTLTLVMFQREQELLPFSQTAVDSFSIGGSEDIRQRGGTLSWMHRLTPLTTLNASVWRIDSDALDVGDTQSTQRIERAALTFRLAQKTTASLALRRSRTNGTGIEATREKAVVCSLTHGF